MKVLIYGLQNSGATLFALFVGQKENSLVLPDIWTPYCAPELDIEVDSCVKATITTTISLEDHKKKFKPDITILVIRRPQDIYASLSRKTFKNDDGSIEDKFILQDKILDDASKFDVVLRFEEFISNPQSTLSLLTNYGWKMPEDAPLMLRSPHEMEMNIWKVAPKLYDSIEWGAGNAHFMSLNNVKLLKSYAEEADKFSKIFAPKLRSLYVNYFDKSTSIREDSYSGLTGGESVQNDLSEVILKMIDRADLTSQENSYSAEYTESYEIYQKSTFAFWEQIVRSAPEENQYDIIKNKISAIILQCDVPNLRKFAIDYFIKKDLIEEAAILLKLASADTYHYANHYFIIAEILMKRKEFTQAEYFLRNHLASNPRSVIANRYLAELLQHYGRPDEAISLLKLCLTLNRSYSPAADLLAVYQNACHS